mgnify:CR=1 FL=1
MKKFISFLLVIALCMSIGISASAEPLQVQATSVSATSDSTVQPRFIRYVTKYITTVAGISITVNLTLNDSTGNITGLQGYKITHCPDGVYNASVVNTIVYDDYVHFILAYTGADGLRHADEGKCYSGF